MSIKHNSLSIISWERKPSRLAVPEAKPARWELRCPSTSSGCSEQSRALSFYGTVLPYLPATGWPLRTLPPPPPGPFIVFIAHPLSQAHVVSSLLLAYLSQLRTAQAWLTPSGPRANLLKRTPPSMRDTVSCFA